MKMKVKLMQLMKLMQVNIGAQLQGAATYRRGRLQSLEAHQRQGSLSGLIHKCDRVLRNINRWFKFLATWYKSSR